MIWNFMFVVIGIPVISFTLLLLGDINLPRIYQIFLIKGFRSRNKNKSGLFVNTVAGLFALICIMAMAYSKLDLFTLSLSGLAICELLMFSPYFGIYLKTYTNYRNNNYN